MGSTELQTALERLDAENFTKIVLSNRKDKSGLYKKTVIRRVQAKDAVYLQCESFTEKQAFQSRIETPTLLSYLKDALSHTFRQMDVFYPDRSVSLKLSKKGKLLLSESKSSSSAAQIQSHDREKNYILPQGTYVPALYDLGVITKDGKVINSRYGKFKQINRFVEMVDDALKNETKDELNIIDFGCGKSYLTFVLYDYLTRVRKIRANVVGLDLKQDVIEDCRKTAEKYGYAGLHFLCGDIKDHRPDFLPDMVITLHACDTATDQALYNAVRWGAKYIFSVPCCQHEVNHSVSALHAEALMEYGLIKERFCALLTDTIRCKLLEAKGYRVDVLEFIDMEHSPKNLLIRAKKANVPAAKKEKAKEQVEALLHEYPCEQTLCRLLSSENE